MKKKKLIIFDLDRVLFNTGFIVEQIKEYKVGMRFSLSHAKKINLTSLSSGRLCFPEVISVLEDLQKKNWELWLFTEGYQTGQEWKLKYAKLERFFPKSKRFIYFKKEPALIKFVPKIKRFEQAFIVDDKPTVLKKAKRVIPNIKTVLVCRGPFWKTKVANFNPDYKINNLNELVSKVI